MYHKYSDDPSKFASQNLQWGYELSHEILVGWQLSAGLPSQLSKYD